jgi:hypothetical protein
LSSLTEHQLVGLRHWTAEFKIIKKADVLKIDFDTNFMIKKKNTVIEREQLLTINMDLE